MGMEICSKALGSNLITHMPTFILFYFERLESRESDQLLRTLVPGLARWLCG